MAIKHKKIIPVKYWGPILGANIQHFLSSVSCKTKLQCILEKNTLKKYDLQESYNNFKIKLKISLCESGL